MKTKKKYPNHENTKREDKKKSAFTPLSQSKKKRISSNKYPGEFMNTMKGKKKIDIVTGKVGKDIRNRLPFTDF